MLQLKGEEIFHVSPALIRIRLLRLVEESLQAPINATHSSRGGHSGIQQQLLSLHRIGVPSANGFVFQVFATVLGMVAKVGPGYLPCRLTQLEIEEFRLRSV